MQLEQIQEYQSNLDPAKKRSSSEAVIIAGMAGTGHQIICLKSKLIISSIALPGFSAL